MEMSMNVKDKKYIEKLVNTYSEKEISKLDELRSLDKKAKKGANIFAYIFGIIGTLILGLGMCIAMEIIFLGMIWLGIIIGIVGILLVSVNYFLYKKLLNKGKNKYSSKILKLSKELLNEEN